MIAAFLKTADGDFDYPALVLAVPLFFFGLFMLVAVLPKALRTGHIPFIYSTRVGHTISRRFERDKNPLLYWLLCAAYFVATLFFITVAIGISFGIFRKMQ